MEVDIPEWLMFCIACGVVIYSVLSHLGKVLTNHSEDEDKGEEEEKQQISVEEFLKDVVFQNDQAVEAPKNSNVEPLLLKSDPHVLHSNENSSSVSSLSQHNKDDKFDFHSQLESYKQKSAIEMRHLESNISSSSLTRKQLLKELYPQDAYALSIKANKEPFLRKMLASKEGRKSFILSKEILGRPFPL